MHKTYTFLPYILLQWRCFFSHIQVWSLTLCSGNHCLLNPCPTALFFLSFICNFFLFSSELQMFSCIWHSPIVICFLLLKTIFSKERCLHVQFLLTHFQTILPPNSTWLPPLPAEWAHPCLMLCPMKTSWSWLLGRIWPYWLFPSSKNALFTGPPWYHALLILPLLLWIHLPSFLRRFLFLQILVFLRVLSLYSHPRESNFLPHLNNHLCADDSQSLSAT